MPRREPPISTRKIGPVFNLDGSIDQAIAADILVVPGRLELHEGCLCYQFYPGGPLDSLALFPTSSEGQALKRSRKDLPVAVNPPPRLVDHFIRLVDAPEEDVLSFSRRWGVLEVCSHGLPIVHGRVENKGDWQHGTPQSCSPLGWEPAGLDPQLSGFTIGRERLSHWRQWARRARALMRIAAAVAMNRPGAFEDWLELRSESMTAERLEEQRDAIARQGALLMLDRYTLYSTVNSWAEIGRVGPRLVARGDGPAVIRFVSGSRSSLFGMIGLQMMVRVTRVGSVAVCSECGKLYKPDRLPNPARQNFCADCGRPAAMKIAKRRMMDRKRRALELYEAGASPTAIAEAVGSRIQTIRRWVKKG
jgi:hypothetical protein